MSVVFTSWPTRVPGRRYLWVLDLETELPAPRCTVHNVRTNGLGVCARCVSEWRASLGADPESWFDCAVCGFPLHPVVEREGHSTCPSCAHLVAGVDVGTHAKTRAR